MANSPKTAFATFLRETISFLSASNYLLAVHIYVLKEKDESISNEHNEFAGKIAPIYKDPRAYFIARLFIAYVAAFEIFLQETISIVIEKHPKKVGSTQFRLADILNATSTNELVQEATEELLNKLMYKKPLEYLQEVCQLLSINRAPLEDGWKFFIESKARRDLGVHNAWKCNSIYLRKLQEAGIPSSLALGDSAVPQDKEYVDRVINSLCKLAEDICVQVVAKYWPEEDE
jgi:hypothetical protein